jgi:choloylglycine hydrolase
VVSSAPLSGGRRLILQAAMILKVVSMNSSLIHSLKSLLSVAIVAALTVTQATSVRACTGIRLIAKDGSSVYGRTMEWGAFDLKSRVAIIPRGYKFTGLTPEGHNGKSWKAKYGAIALDILGGDMFADGMNEAGLSVGLFYHPGFAEYSKYDRTQASNSITAVDVVAYILAQFATVDEVRRAMSEVRVVPVVEKAIGIPVYGHWMVTEPSGKSIVIEYKDGKVRIFDNTLGVITNAPNYDWHLTNLRNYINLSAVALPTKSLQELSFAPLGAGSGMIGLPGDNTPPSRFIRAVAWTQTARSTPNSGEAVYETLRILDNFNLPLGGAEGSGGEGSDLKGMRSSTIWTTAWDLSQKTLYFHTQHNRRLRSVDMNRINLLAKKIRHIQLDERKEQDVSDLTPK